MAAAPRPSPADAVVAALRAACLALPEVVEAAAWTGTRWVVRRKTFAHVVHLADGWPPVYARQAGTDGPVDVLTFRSSGPELEALGAVGPPFFRPPWAPGLVGMLLGSTTDWDEVRELLVESYCLLAPARLAQQVARPEA